MNDGIVIVQTWGTDSQSYFGVKRLVAAFYRGENVGHASIELRLPDNEENTQLINTYCQGRTIIPWVKKFELNNEGILESFYVVRFSFVSSDKGELFELIPTYEDDTYFERAGHHTTERHYLETFDLVERRGRRRVIKLFPACSLTEQGRVLDFTSAKGKYVLNIKDYFNYLELRDTATLIKKKINDLHENHKNLDLNHPGNKTILLAAKRLGLALPKKGIIPEEQLELLLSQLSIIQDEIKEKTEGILERLRQLATKIQNNEENDKCVSQSDEIRKILNTFPTLSDFDNFDVWYRENPNISKEIKEKIDALYPSHREDIFDDFRQQVKSDLLNLRDFYSDIISKNQFEAQVFFQSIDKFLYFGRPADSQVQLRIGSGKYELNAEFMLAQMRNIVDSGFEYDLRKHNCSTTVLSILNAGRQGKTIEVCPNKVLLTTTPQIVYNTAVKLRDNACSLSARRSLSELHVFYTNRAQKNLLTVKSRECANLHESIVRFAIDTFFPEENDVRDNIFYTFSKSAEKSILRNSTQPIPTELLRDLWGIIPERTLPLSKSKSHSAVINQSMTIRQLIQGLTVLAQINSEKRFPKNYASNSDNIEQDSVKTIRKEIITGKIRNKQAHPFLTKLLATGGLGIGVGVLLVSTGVFTFFGVGVLGAVATAAAIGGSWVLISGTLGFGVAQWSESPTPIRTGGTINNLNADVFDSGSAQALAKLGSFLSQEPRFRATDFSKSNRALESNSNWKHHEELVVMKEWPEVAPCFKAE